MKKQKTLAIIGSTGLVGEELYTILKEDGYPLNNVKKFSKSTTPAEAASFENVHLAFFCTNTEISKKYIPKALSYGCIAIDSSSAYRMEKNIPLVIPEINKELLSSRPQLIASPNCTASIMLMALSPIYKHFGIKRVFASTYQAASGAGKQGLAALQGTDANTPFPHPLHQNLFLHEAAMSEEEKVQQEIQKILQTDFPIHIRTVRVPVERAHSISMHIELERAAKAEEVDAALQKMDGLKLHKSPTPLMASQQNAVFCTPACLEKNHPMLLSLFVVGDQLRKGAALNAWQIAKHLL